MLIKTMWFARLWFARLCGVKLACCALVACAVLPVSVARAAFPSPVSAPDGKGDQVVFYYDARDGFATFLNLRNESAAELVATMLFYGPDFGTPFAENVILPAGALTIIDTTALRGAGLPPQFGVAIATSVDLSGAPIVTRGLSGNFTVANLRTNSAWGSAGGARRALQNTHKPRETPPPPDLGSVIDGTDVALPPIQPASANLAAYFDPDGLAPASEGGNQLIFISFEDVPGAQYVAQSASTTWSVAAAKSNGAPFGATSFVSAGVVVSDLASVLGDGVHGGSGSAVFAASHSSHPITRLVYFAESLGTFGTGYLLPRGRAASAATPTPAATP